LLITSAIYDILLNFLFYITEVNSIFNFILYD